MLVNTKAKVGVFSIALGAYLPQFPSLVPEFEAQYDAFKKTIPDTVEIVDGGMVTTKEQAMVAGDKFRAADVDLVFLQMLTYATSYNMLPAIRDLDVPVVLVNVQKIKALDQQLQKADIVIGCLPGTPETKGLLNYERLYSMKKDAILVNVGRGSLIPTEDLIRVLEEGHLKGAVLDVFETEPLPETSPLWNMENVLITPHIAGPSFGGNAEVQDMIWNICMENMERYLNGKKLKNIVRLKNGY